MVAGLKDMLGSLIDKNMISEQKCRMTSLVLIFPPGFNNKNEPLDYHADILMPACTKSAGWGRATNSLQDFSASSR
jgi:hypothetical protein